MVAFAVTIGGCARRARSIMGSSTDLSKRFEMFMATAVLSVALSAIAAAQADYVVGPQDVLTVTIWSRPELSGQFTVDADGNVKLPLIDRVKVGGLTARNIEEA